MKEKKGKKQLESEREKIIDVYMGEEKTRNFFDDIIIKKLLLINRPLRGSIEEQ